MFSRLRSRLTYSNITSSIALFVALGGGAAYAADTIGSSDVIDESLLSQDLKNGEGVKNADIAPSTIQGGKVANDSLTGSDVTALTGADVTDGSLGGVDLANFGVTTAKLASDAVTREKLGFKAVDQNAMDDDSVAGAEIVNSSVRSDDINTAAVGSREIGNDAVEGPELGTIAQRTKTINVAGSAIDGDRAACNPGEQVISGGSRAIPGPFVRILDSYRDGNGWTVTVRNETFRDNVVSLEIYAYCLVP